MKKFSSQNFNLDFLLRIAGIPKSTFFPKPYEEKCISNRGRWIPEFSRTINGEIVSEEAIKTLLFELAEEYPRYGYKKLNSSSEISVWHKGQQEEGLQAM